MAFGPSFWYCLKLTFTGGGMKRCLAMSVMLALAACGPKQDPKKNGPTQAGNSAAAPSDREKPRSDPGGTYSCLKCNVKLKDPKCRFCGESLKSEASGSSGNGSSSHSKSTVSPTYACPKDGCKYWSPRKEKCLSHADTDLKARWYVCKACPAMEPQPGNCPTCKRELVRELRDE